MVQIRDESGFADREQLDSSFKAFVVALQLLGIGSKDRVKLMAEELDHQPQTELCQQKPCPYAFPKEIGDNSAGIQQEKPKLNALKAHPINQPNLSEPPREGAAQKP